MRITKLFVQPPGGQRPPMSFQAFEVGQAAQGGRRQEFGSRSSRGPSRKAVPQGLVPQGERPPHAFWRGRTGRLYHHAVHELFTCPPPQRASYVLARRDETGRAVPLFIGIAGSQSATLNLARIRQRAALLGADEVHMLSIPPSAGLSAARRIVRDLRAAARAAS